ncbi:MAG: hypothetical protein H6739_14005 [Alphaproteobacteria bacterium]|nr:hypothetical protein [Alphaproteobacteria bacterium]
MLRNKTIGRFVSSPPVSAERNPGRLEFGLALAIALTVMLLPMLLIGELVDAPETPDSAVAMGATAALGAIFRASARNILRSTFMMAIRATSRAVSRRVARAVLRSLMSLFLPTMKLPELKLRRMPGWLAVSIGFVALILSFAGVLAQVDDSTRASLTAGTPGPFVAVLAALPLLAHATMMRFLARYHKLQVSFETTIDGLLLQAYFTGAASFLPLASDAELEGPKVAKAKCAAGVLAGLLVCHFLCAGLAALTGVAALSLLSTMFLLYVFVFSFPLKPLDGGDIWAASRGWWCAMWVPVLAAFMTRLPEVFYDIL